MIIWLLNVYSIFSSHIAFLFPTSLASRIFCFMHSTPCCCHIDSSLRFKNECHELISDKDAGFSFLFFSPLTLGFLTRSADNHENVLHS